MAAKDVPAGWAELLIKAGLTDPRDDKRASMTQLGEAAHVHPSTISHAMYGTRKTSAETANKLAMAIADRLPAVDKQKSRRRVLRLINEAWGDVTPFVLHPDADLLDEGERKVVNELIGLLARSKRQQGERTLYLVDEAAYDPDKK